MGDLVEIRGVTHAYRTKAGPLPVLDDLTLGIPEGKFCAVVGPSGCGKSTLTRLIAGLMKPDRRRGLSAWRAGEDPRARRWAWRFRTRCCWNGAAFWKT
jgi:ABC-type nitrate/sulfonate/bicarbonate transport system ATPase subunit